MHRNVSVPGMVVIFVFFLSAFAEDVTLVFIFIEVDVKNNKLVFFVHINSSYQSLFTSFVESTRGYERA